MLAGRLYSVSRGGLTVVRRSRFQRFASTSSTGVDSVTDAVSSGSPGPVNESADIVGSAADFILRSHNVISSDGSLFGWGVTLAATACVVRVASLPLLYYGQVQQSRAALATKELGRIQSFVRSSQGSLFQKYMTFRRLRAVALGACGTSSLKLFPWFTVVNLPIFVTTSFAIRRIASDPPTTWASDGVAGWFPDLSSADPTGVLPVINTSLWIWNAHIRSSSSKNMSPGGVSSVAVSNDGKSSSPDKSVNTKRSGKPRGLIGAVLSGEALTVGMQALAVFSFPFILQMPSGMLLFWITSGSLTAVQRAVLSTDGGRRAIGLPTADELRAAAKSTGPPVLQATGRAVRAVRDQLEYVQSEVLARYDSRTIDESLRQEVNSALNREKRNGRIGIDLESVIRKDEDTGRSYLAVIRKGTNPT